MRLVLDPSIQSITVALEVAGGVELDTPELWQHDGQSYVELPAPVTNVSAAVWQGVPVRGPDGSVILQLYWSAFDPMHDRWRYQALIAVQDQDGNLLTGRDGHRNPTERACDVGATVPSYSHEQEPISILP